MSTTVDVHDLPARLHEVLAKALSGDEVIVTEGSAPRARLLPLAMALAPQPRVAGLHAGAIEASADFDAPLPDEFWAGRP